MTRVEAEVRLDAPVKSRRGERIAIAVMLGVYALVNVAAWSGTEPVLTWDSSRYTSGEIFLFLNPGVPPTLLFSSIASLELATFVHVAVYVLAWSSFVLALLNSLKVTWIKWPLTIITLLISLTSPLWSWNLVVGSEGLTVSSLVLWMSALVWLSASSRTMVFFLSALAAAAVLITRPQMLIFVIPIQLIASLWWIRRNNYRFRELRTVLLGALIVLLASAGWATYRAALLANDDVYSFRYALHNLVEKTPSFREYVLQEAPTCEAIPAALDGPQPWTDVIAFDQTLISLCPETFIWFKSSAVSPQSWIAYDPVAAALNFRDVMWGIALPVGAEYSILPGAIDDALLPVHNVWLAIAVGLALGLILGILGGVRYRVTAWGVIAVVAALGSVAVYLFAVWAADGYDVIRHMVPVTTLLPLAALTLPSGLAGKKITTEPG